MAKTLFKTVRQFLKNLNTELPYDPNIPLLGIYLKELKIGTRRVICTPMSIAALFLIAKRWKQAKCPLVGECVGNMGYIIQQNIIQPLKGMKF